MSTAPDLVDRRALAWVRFVDAATAQAVTTPVAVRADGARLFRKPGGDLAVFDVGALPGSDTFAAAPGAAVGSVAIAVDAVPAGTRYAPRRVTLRLPRDPDPANAATGGSLFQPALATLYPAAGYVPSGLLAGVRATVRRAGDGARVEGAVVRLSSAGVVVARALSDAAGEALLVAGGIALANAGPGATVVHDVAASVDVIADPSLARFAADGEVAAARSAATARHAGLIDPDDVETRLAAAASPAVAVLIRAGSVVALDLTWTPA